MKTQKKVSIYPKIGTWEFECPHCGYYYTVPNSEVSFGRYSCKYCGECFIVKSR